MHISTRAIVMKMKIPYTLGLLRLNLHLCSAQSAHFISFMLKWEPCITRLLIHLSCGKAARNIKTIYFYAYQIAHAWTITGRSIRNG